ncbi:hypothetical protein [Roseixanthobacter pseudopolyaromaticivorans]|uniref:hypothetical protein n=1 Tax=Xanthobacteraceae TaxID=335928 RepID=UPI00372A6262
MDAPRYTEQEWRDRDDLRRYWADFCEADPVPEGFIDRMEAAGLAQCRAVEPDDLEESFADERGIYPGGMVWELTDVGRASLKQGGE